MRHLGAAFLLAFAIAAHAQTPVISPGGVLNGASFDKTGQPIPPGALVSVFGTNLTAATATASSVPLSTNLSGVSVTINGVAAPMLAVVKTPDYDQLNLQVPWEVSTSGTAQVVVSRNGVTSAPQTITMGPAAPGIFAFNGTQAVAYGNSDGAIAAAVNAGLPFTSHPAKILDPTTLVILCTGLGPVNPPVRTGSDANDGLLHQAVTQPTVTVGGVPAQVVFAGMTPQFVGVYQLNIVIAAGTPTGNAIPIRITSNGVTSPDGVTIAVSQ
jgi:trimeric autotransporter adhesin